LFCGGCEMKKKEGGGWCSLGKGGLGGGGGE